jgi:hypothetical protein
MTYNDAERIYQVLTASSCQSLVRDLLDSAVAYARIRTTWALAAFEERREQSGVRTRAHNALIDYCNVVSRSMAAAGEDNSWRVELGDDRRVIGDFACYLHCILGLNAR